LHSKKRTIQNQVNGVINTLTSAPVCNRKLEDRQKEWVDLLCSLELLFTHSLAWKV
jgi:hypothetical protein